MSSSDEAEQHAEGGLIMDPGSDAEGENASSQNDSNHSSSSFSYSDSDEEGVEDDEAAYHHNLNVQSPSPLMVIGNGLAHHHHHHHHHFGGGVAEGNGAEDVDTATMMSEDDDDDSDGDDDQHDAYVGMEHDGDDEDAEEGGGGGSGEGEDGQTLQFVVSPQQFTPAALQAIAELANLGNEIPDIRDLLDRVISRLGGQSVGRLDALLLQVLLARVSLAEMQYQQQLREALRISFEENQDKPCGPPPALDEDIANLTKVTIALEHLQCTDKQQCVVCLDTFKVGDSAVQLPCSHVYCEDCILPWLKHHGTCPFCRETVQDVKKEEFSFDLCGYRQLNPALCQCVEKDAVAVAPRLMVLPGCSHAFGAACLRANLTDSEAGPTATQRMIQCPLCHKPSLVKSSLLPAQPTAVAKRSASLGHRNPLRNREPAHWQQQQAPLTGANISTTTPGSNMPVGAGDPATASQVHRQSLPPTTVDTESDEDDPRQPRNQSVEQPSDPRLMDYLQYRPMPAHYHLSQQQQQRHPYFSEGYGGNGEGMPGYDFGEYDDDGMEYPHHHHGYDDEIDDGQEGDDDEEVEEEYERRRSHSRGVQAGVGAQLRAPHLQPLHSGALVQTHSRSSGLQPVLPSPHTSTTNNSTDSPRQFYHTFHASSGNRPRTPSSITSTPRQRLQTLSQSADSHPFLHSSSPQSTSFGRSSHHASSDTSTTSSATSIHTGSSTSSSSSNFSGPLISPTHHPQPSSSRPNSIQQQEPGTIRRLGSVRRLPLNGPLPSLTRARAPTASGSSSVNGGSSSVNLRN